MSGIPSGWARVPGPDGKYAIDHQSRLLRVSRAVVRDANRYTAWLAMPGYSWQAGESFDTVQEACAWAETKLPPEE